MRVMLATGYIDYETFDGDHEENPIEKGKMFDVSTPEKLKNAKIQVIQMLNHDYGDHYIISHNPAPKEPVLTLSQMKDAQKVAKVTKQFEALKELHKKKAEQNSNFYAIIVAKPENYGNFSDELVDQAFDAVQKAVTNDGYVQRIYFYDV